MSRTITSDEAAIVRRLLELSEAAPSMHNRVDGALVQSMQDGDMGSFRFISNKGTRQATQIAHGVARDSDGVWLDITINVDQDGDLFELDIWKVDFSPIRQYPRPEEVERAASAQAPTKK